MPEQALGDEPAYVQFQVAGDFVEEGHVGMPDCTASVFVMT